MPLPIEYNLYITKDAYEFENIVCDVCIKKFRRNFQRFGKTGQNQLGVDITSVDRQDLICVQCKNYAISPKEINTIIDKVMQFDHPISEFIIAIGAYQDTKLQEKIIEVNCRDNLKFRVYIMFWEEISNIISQNQDLLSKYYPTISKSSIECLVFRFNNLINKYHILEYVNIDPIIGVPKYYPGFVDCFLLDIGETLKQLNTLQQHPKFIAINKFYDTVNDYCYYLGIKLFPTDTMYTIQNPYDLEDISNENSKIKRKIYDYKKRLDTLYGEINDGCSMFLVRQYL